MEIGTAEPIVEKKKRRRLRTGISGGGSSGPGNGNNGGGDEGDENYLSRNNFPEAEQPAADKGRIITWFLLLVVAMTFGGLIGAYVMISTNKAAEWKPFELPIGVWISTFLILVSSVVYAIAKNAIDRQNNGRVRSSLIITTALGAAFISSQVLAWMALANRGLYMQGNPYAGFFYILTAVHALHVLGGIIALGSILLRCWYDTASEPEILYRKNLARSVGVYWHFMGALWIILFILLGFWK